MPGCEITSVASRRIQAWYCTWSRRVVHARARPHDAAEAAASLHITEKALRQREMANVVDPDSFFKPLLRARDQCTVDGLAAQRAFALLDASVES